MFLPKVRLSAIVWMWIVASERNGAFSHDSWSMESSRWVWCKTWAMLRQCPCSFRTTPLKMIAHHILISGLTSGAIKHGLLESSSLVSRMFFFSHKPPLITDFPGAHHFWWSKVNPCSQVRTNHVLQCFSSSSQSSLWLRISLNKETIQHALTYEHIWTCYEHLLAFFTMC